MKNLFNFSALLLATTCVSHIVFAASVSAACVSSWKDLEKLNKFKAFNVATIAQRGRVTFKAKDKNYVLISSGNSIVLQTPKGNATVNSICLKGSSLVANVSAMGGMYKNTVTLKNAGANRVIVQEGGNADTVTATAIY